MNIFGSRMAAAVAGLCLLLGTTARAIPVIDSSYLLGTVAPGSPADSTSEAARLSTLILMYNAGSPTSPYTVSNHPKDIVYTLDVGGNVPSPNLPGIENFGSQVPLLDQSMFNFDLGLGSDYALVKWGDIAAYYWTRGFEGLVTFKNDNVVVNRGNGNPLGGSHLVQFNRIPDGGLTILLLGAAFIGMAVVHRFRSGRVA